MLPLRAPLVFMCELTFLVFSQTSENHKMVVNGFKPSLGEHYCFLCWRGYNRPGVLQSHYNGPSHAEQVEKQGVKAIWKKADVEADSKGKDEFKCPACNLVFVSEQSEQNHRQSERHSAVIQRSRPQDSRNRPGRYCCFLCWHGFEVSISIKDKHCFTPETDIFSCGKAYRSSREKGSFFVLSFFLSKFKRRSKQSKQT